MNQDDVLEVLRGGGLMTAPEIARVLCPDASEWEHQNNRVKVAVKLSALARWGFVVKWGKDGNTTVWRAVE